MDVVRLAIAAVAVLGEAGRPGALEVGAGDVIEHQVRLEAEQVAEAVIKSHLDALLGGHELIEGSVPGLQLAKVDTNPLVLVPLRNKPATLAVTDEVGLQPPRQAMFTRGVDQAIRNKHEGSVGKRHARGFAERLIEDRPQSQLVEQGPNGEDGSPGGGVEDIEIFVLRGSGIDVLAE